MCLLKKIHAWCVFVVFISSILLNGCGSYYKMVNLKVDERRPYKGDTVVFSWKFKQPWKIDSVYFQGERIEKQIKEQQFVADTQKRYSIVAYTNEGRKIRKSLTLRVRQPRLLNFSVPDTVFNDSVFRFGWLVKDADSVYINGLGKTDMYGVRKMRLHSDTTIHISIFGKNNIVIEKHRSIKVIYKDTIDYPGFVVKNEDQAIHYRFEGTGKVFVLPMKDSIPLQGKYIINIDSSQSIQFVVNRFGRMDTLSYRMSVILPEFLHVNATYNMVKNQHGFIEWETAGADSIFIRPMNKFYPANGRVTISPNETTTYFLEVRKANQVVSKRSVQVEVFERRYVEGEIDVQQIKDDREFYYDVVGVNMDNYPESVGLKVIVVDDEGNFVKNLAPPYGIDSAYMKYFKELVLCKMGKEKPVGFTVKEVHEQQSDPYDISLTLDYSGSMYSFKDQLNQAAKTFIVNKNPYDRIAITKFDHRIKTFNLLSKDRDRLIETGNFFEMDGLGGSTALYAACDKASETIDGSRHSKVMILFSDGFENASMQYSGVLATQPDSVAKKLLRKNIKLYTVGFGYGANVGLLNSLSDLTDGKFYYCHTPEQINQVFAELPYIIHNYYEITFKTDGFFKGKNKVKFRMNNNQNRTVELPRTFDLKKVVDLKKYETNETVCSYFPSVSNNGKKPITAPQTAVLFDFDESYISAEYYKVLSRYASYLNVHKDVEILLAGHSDLSGTNKRCWDISEKRIENVKQYLIAQGISADRICEKAYGKTNPVWQKEKHEWQARENRRVDIIFYR